MPRRLADLPRSVTLTALALAALACFGTAAATLGWNTRPAAPAATQGAGGGPVRVVRFALYDAGILPREAHVERGRVVVSISDYTGGSEGLVIEVGEGQERRSVGVVRRAGPRWRGREELNLSPGTYQLYDASRPENRATLVVEP